MADSDDVSVRFGADLSNLNSTIDRARTQISSFSGSIKSAFTGVDVSGVTDAFKDIGDSAKNSGQDTEGAFGKIRSVLMDMTLTVGALAAAATDYLIKTGEDAVRLGEQIKTAAGAFDQTTQSMSEIKSVAESTGVSFDDLGKSFADLQKNAKSGDDGTVAALKAIGVSADNVANLTQDALAVKMADAFSKARDSSNKAAAGVALFGADIAGKLVPQLDQGAARMKDLEDAANRAGTVIGPDLMSKIEGTSSVFQEMHDRLQELAMTAKGEMLESFVQLKPAIDGLVQTFADIVKNVTDLTEWFFSLNGAAQQNTQSMGILATAAKWFAEAVVEATAYIEEMAVRCVKALDDMGINFMSLANVASAFGEDIKNMASNAATSLYNAFHESIQGVILLFGDLAHAGKEALSFDFSGVSTAFAKFGDDAAGVGGKIKSALSPELFSKSKEALADMQKGAAAESAELDKVIARLEAQKNAQLALINSGGAKAPQSGSAAVGDPSAAADKDNSEALQSTMRELDGEIQAIQATEKQKELLLDAGVKMHQISEDQKVAATKDALQDQLQDEMAVFQQELSLDGLKLEQKQEILNKMQAAQAKYDQDILKLEIQAAEQTRENWNKAFQEINSAFTSQIDGLLRGTTSFASAFKNVLASLLEELIKFFVEWGLKQAETVALNVAGFNTQATAQIAGAAAGTAAETAGASASLAAHSATILDTIVLDAKAVFGGIFAFLAPLLGPAAAGPATAGAATVTAFDIGAWNLPSDQLAMVHKNELVMPAAEAGAFRDMLSSQANGGESSGGSSRQPIHSHVHFHTTAMDSRDVRRFFGDNAKHIMSAINDGIKSGSHLGFTKLRGAGM